MKGKRIFSLALSAAIGISAAAGISLKSEKPAEAAGAVETDYIGSSTKAETFDSYTPTGWSSVTSTSGTLSVASHDDTDYTSGNVLNYTVRGGSELTHAFTDDAADNGTVYFNSAIGSSGSYNHGGPVSLIDSSGNAVISIKVPDGTGKITVSSNAGDSKSTANSFAGRSDKSFKVESEINLDNSTAAVSVTYVKDGSDYTENYTLSVNSGSDIAGVSISLKSASSQNSQIYLDNTQFYSIAEAPVVTDMDYIGTSTTAETFTGYTIPSNWSYSDTRYGSLGLQTVTEVAKPEVGSVVSSTTSGRRTTYNYPTYVSGSALAVTERGNTTNTAKFALSSPRSVGSVFLKTDIGIYSSLTAYRGGSVYLYNSSGDAVLKISIPNTRSGRYTITGASTVQSSQYISTRKASYDGLRVEIELDLDMDMAIIILDYVATDNIRYQDELIVDIADTNIAGLAMTVTSSNRVNDYTMIDNTQFYATAPAAVETPEPTAEPTPEPTEEPYYDDPDATEPQYIRVSYKTSSGYTVATKMIDIREQGCSEGDSVTYYVSAYVDGKDGNLYKTSPTYSRTATVKNGTTSVNETVGPEFSGTYQYVDFDDSAPFGHIEYASGGKLKNTGETYDLMTVTESGYYTVIIATGLVRGGDTRTGTLYSGETVIADSLSFTSYTGARGTYTSQLLNKGEKLKVTSSDGRASVDYILIMKTANALTNMGTRRMEDLGRGTFAVYTGSGVYLSWRLLGTESLANQAFDIYRNGTKIKTTGVHDATNYTDSGGTASSSYIVVPKGESISGETAVMPKGTYDSYAPSGYAKNVNAYFDIAIDTPADATPAPAADGTTNTTAASYTPNDASVGDLDGDGEYEIVLKWYPSNAKDNSSSGLTSNVYIDAYKLDGTKLWRIDLGKNIRAGAHYTQFMVYDLDGDGKAEVAMQTAPGSVDGTGNYVTAAGDTAEIRSADNGANYRTKYGYILSGPEYLTVFNGETGAAMCTTDYIARGNVSDWGDSYGNRCDRMLAGIAYLNGTTPSLIFSRGYYSKAVMAAYDWDGGTITHTWLNESATSAQCTVTYADGTSVTQTTAKYGGGAGSIYGEGDHSLGVCDADGDGKDEIVFNSAVVDDDGQVLHRTGHGHGDAHHISDFNNDGEQEIMNVHEAPSISAQGYAAEYRKALDGTILNDISLQAAEVDNGRGIMDNFLDDVENYGHSQFWSSGVTGVFSSDTAKGTNGQIASNTPGWYNFAVYWDKDLARELLDDNKLAKLNIYNSTDEETGETSINAGVTRFIWSSTSWFPASSSINGSKATPCLSADILGDWREEVIFKVGATKLRVFVPAEPTDYRLYTLMHDCQYREGVAMENVAYNQPPHTSYYIGSDALATDSSGNKLNYLGPKAEYNKMAVVEEVGNVEIAIEQGGNEANTNGTYNAVFNNTISVPEELSLSADDITVTIGGIIGTKNTGFYEKLNAITGGSITFNAAVTDIPEGADLSGIEIKTAVDYIINETAKRTAVDSVTIE